MTRIFAHSLENEPEEDWQPLIEHLLAVAKTASSFAEPFGGDELAYAAGLLHDLGKASEVFQRRLRGAPVSVDHSTSGAAEAIEAYGEDIGTLIALCIAGHHGGIPNGRMRSIEEGGGEYPSSRRPLKQRLGKVDKDEVARETQWLLRNLRDCCAELPTLTVDSIPEHFYGSGNRRRDAVSMHVLMEVLFSCLVDADYLDTERVMDTEVSQARAAARHESLAELFEKYEKWMSKFPEPRTDMDVARSLVAADAMEAANQPIGVYTMTVGTGGGKTLASVGYALRHAIANGLNRVIVATPFMTITDQTAAIFRDIFGERNVLEHQSSYDFDGNDDAVSESMRLATENWDVPIVVTTNVQLFESLFSNKPGKSRKVHNIANSVVVLDEAQIIPDHVLKPTLAMIEAFSRDCRTSFLLCSATQPPLAGEWPFGSAPREIIGKHDVFERAFASRVSYLNRGRMETEELAIELSNLDQVLCVVDSKRKARMVYERLCALAPDCADYDPCSRGVFHLSAAMCPAHRLAVLGEVRRRLDADEPCLVVSTQLIEAGVDVSFPVIYRELAGMDSIVQSAGRCNRSGEHDKGLVHVFELCEDGERLKSSPWIEDMKRISRQLVKANGDEIGEPLVEPYFLDRYEFAEKDDRNVLESLSRPDRAEQTALDYRFIDSQARAVFVPYGEEGRVLLSDIERVRFPGMFARKAQRFSVTVTEYEFQALSAAGALREIPPFQVLRTGDGCEELYSDNVGLLKPGEGDMPPVIL